MMFLISEEYIAHRIASLHKEVEECFGKIHTCDNPTELAQIGRKGNAAASRIDELKQLVQAAKQPK